MLFIPQLVVLKLPFLALVAVVVGFVVLFVGFVLRLVRTQMGHEVNPDKKFLLRMFLCWVGALAFLAMYAWLSGDYAVLFD